MTRRVKMTASGAQVGTSAASQDRLHARNSVNQVRVLMRVEGRPVRTARLASIQISVVPPIAWIANQAFTWSMVEECNAYLVYKGSLQNTIRQKNALCVREVQPPEARERALNLNAFVKRAVSGTTTATCAHSALISLAFHAQEALQTRHWFSKISWCCLTTHYSRTPVSSPAQDVRETAMFMHKMVRFKHVRSTLTPHRHSVQTVRVTIGHRRVANVTSVLKHTLSYWR